MRSCKRPWIVSKRKALVDYTREESISASTRRETAATGQAKERGKGNNEPRHGQTGYIRFRLASIVVQAVLPLSPTVVCLCHQPTASLPRQDRSMPVSEDPIFAKSSSRLANIDLFQHHRVRPNGGNARPLFQGDSLF
jgi:hypothetical protein